MLTDPPQGRHSTRLDQTEGEERSTPVQHAGRRPTFTTALASAASLVTTTAAVLAAALAAPVLASPASAAPPSATDATTLYRQALATTRGWSVHYESLASVSSTTILESGDAGPASGTQTVAVGKSKTALTDDATIIVIGAITYLKGNASALSDMAGLSPSQAAAESGQWIQFATDNATLASVSAGVRSTDVAKELELTGPYTVGRARTLQGTGVDAVEGSQKIGGKHVQVVLYVRARGRHVPVEEDAVDGEGKPSGVLHVVYSKWGEVVRPVAPLAAGSIGPVSST
jgi:hypothetical protein